VCVCVYMCKLLNIILHTHHMHARPHTHTHQ